MLEFIRLFFAFFCWLLVWCLAFWRGRWPERTAAAVTLFLGFVPLFVPHHFTKVQFNYPTFFIDLSLFILFVVLGIKSHRIWPAPAAGFQLIAVLVHFAFFIQKPTSNWSYASVSVLATWLVLITFYLGLLENEWRRRVERTLAARYAEAGQDAPA